jgi:hypothetical protein
MTTVGSEGAAAADVGTDTFSGFWVFDCNVPL